MILGNQTSHERYGRWWEMGGAIFRAIIWETWDQRLQLIQSALGFLFPGGCAGTHSPKLWSEKKQPTLHKTKMLEHQTSTKPISRFAIMGFRLTYIFVICNAETRKLPAWTFGEPPSFVAPSAVLQNSSLGDLAKLVSWKTPKFGMVHGGTRWGHKTNGKRLFFFSSIAFGLLKSIYYGIKWGQEWTKISPTLCFRIFKLDIAQKCFRNCGRVGELETSTSLDPWSSWRCDQQVIYGYHLKHPGCSIEEPLGATSCRNMPGTGWRLDVTCSAKPLAPDAFPGWSPKKDQQKHATGGNSCNRHEIPPLSTEASVDNTPLGTSVGCPGLSGCNENRKHHGGKLLNLHTISQTSTFCPNNMRSNYQQRVKGGFYRWLVLLDEGLHPQWRPWSPRG